MSTSVARLMPSMRLWRQPYLLSNFDLVTASLTLIAGNSNDALARHLVEAVHAGRGLLGDPADAGRHRRPLGGVLGEHRAEHVEHDRRTPRCRRSRAGTAPAFSNSTPLWTSSVASPPSSRIIVGPSWPGQVSAWSVHHQYSSSDSPFHAKTGTPLGASGVPVGPTATAAAAWSCVEKMLQLAQRTSAPRATSVSMSTAVWTVMCRLPVTRAPTSGRDAPNSARMAMRPGISCSARPDLLSPELGEGQVGDLEVVGGHGRASLGACAPSIPKLGADFCRSTPCAGKRSARGRSDRSPAQRSLNIEVAMTS